MPFFLPLIPILGAAAGVGICVKSALDIEAEEHGKKKDKQTAPKSPRTSVDTHRQD